MATMTGLAAQVAVTVGADGQLIFCLMWTGLFRQSAPPRPPPKQDATAAALRSDRRITPQIEAMAGECRIGPFQRRHERAN